MTLQRIRHRGLSWTLSCVLATLSFLAVWPQPQAFAGGGKELAAPPVDCIDRPGTDLHSPALMSYGVPDSNGGASTDPLSSSSGSCFWPWELVPKTGQRLVVTSEESCGPCGSCETSYTTGYITFTYNVLIWRLCSDGYDLALTTTGHEDGGTPHEGVFGRLWSVTGDPYIIKQGTGASAKYIVVLGTGLSYTFDDSFDPDCSDTDYTGVTLTSANDLLTLKISRGLSSVRWEFHDFVQTAKRQGQFNAYQTSRSRFYVSAYDAWNNITTVSRANAVNGVYGSPVERVQYGGYNNAEGYREWVYHEYLNESATWVPTRRTDFVYSMDGDVEEVTYYAGYDGSGAGSDLGNWDDTIGQMVFRYDGDQRLILALDTEAVASAQADSVDPLNLATSNAVLEDYATRVYTYHDDDGGTKPWREGMVATISGANCGGCGTNAGSMSIEWAQNSSVTGSGGANRYDYWWRRSTEEIKDENGDVYRRSTLYINRAGKPLCRIVESRSDVFGAGGDLQKADITFYEYNSDGRLEQTFEPSVVNTYPTDVNGEVDFTALDLKNLLEEAGGLVMHANEGVIRLIDYYSATTATTTVPGGVDGYVQYYKVQNGTSGTPITLRELKYIKSPNVIGSSVYPLAEEVRYLESTSAWVSTRWAYTWFKGLKPLSITRYRFINENENDPSKDDALVETLVQSRDQNRVWRKDEQGVITYYLREDIQEVGMIVAPDTDQNGAGEVFNGVKIPLGFTNSGGRHLRTDFQTDEYNRMTRVLGPEYNADADGDGDMDDPVRPVRWTAYNDSVYTSSWSRNEVRTASGYYDVVADTYHLVGGIGVRVTDRGKDSSGVMWSDSYTTERAAVSGELTAGEDVATRSRWSGWSRTKTVDDDMTERWVYVDIPASGDGTAGTNYLKTTYGYHLDGSVRYTEGPDGLRSYSFWSKKTVGSDTRWETRRYQVYDDGGTWRLAAPISVSWSDDDGRGVRSFMATTSGGLDSAVAASGGHPTGADTLTALSRMSMTYDWRHRPLERWSYFDLGALTEAQDGAEGTNYVVTEILAYDEQGRVLRTQASSGDITANVYDALGRTVETWVGTDDTNATRTNPGAGSSDLVQTYNAIYNEDGDGPPRAHLIRAEWLKPNLDGSLDGSSDEFTGAVYTYDDLGRRTRILPDVGPRTFVTYNDAGQTVSTVIYKNPGSPTTPADLLAQSTSIYDGAGRVVESRVYEVDGSSAPSKYIASTVAYDALGRQALSFNAQGAGSLTEWDDAGRVIRQTVFSDNGGDDTDPSDDIVVTETVIDYLTSGPGAGRPYLRTSYQRNHDANAATGDLLSTQPSIAQRTYSATWYDQAGRATHSAYYGHNGHAALTDYDPGGGGTTYGDGPPAPDSSDNVIVSQTNYDDAARVDTVTANDGVVSKFFYNDAGQRTHVVENYDAAKLTGGDPDTPASRDPDVNRITAFVYNLELGTVEQQIAVDPDHDGNTSDNQATTYLYAIDFATGNKGTPSGGVQSNSFLRAVVYPDSDDGVTGGGNFTNGADSTYDRVQLNYYSDGTLQKRKDQNGTVLQSVYHDNGALEYQDATVLGTNVDSAVRSIGYAYDDLYRVTTVTQYDDVSTGTPTAVNEVLNTYTDLGQLEEQFQEHDGTKGGSTLSVGYEYETGNGGGDLYPTDRRLDAVVYPDGRHVFPTYGSNGDISHELGIVRAIWDDNGSGSQGSQQVRYHHFGTSGLAEVRYAKLANDVVLTHHFGDSDGDYEGYDRFYRQTTMRWWQTGGDKARIEYGYDRGSRRVYHEDVVASANTADLDQLDTRNAFGELTNWKLGNVTDSDADTIPDQILPAARERTQDWTLDQLGNWEEFKHDTNGDEDFVDDDDLDQSRLTNDANEITGIAKYGSQAAWPTPIYDAAGGMTSLPLPNDPETAADATYDAWGRLVKLETGSDTVAEYEYDGLGRRIIRHVYDGGTFDYSDHSYYNGWQVVEVRRDTDSTKGGDPDADPMEQFVYHLYYIDAVAVRYWDDPDDGGGLEGTQAEQYYAHDAQFSVIAMMDDTGAVLERYRYTPYGEQTVMDASYSVKTGGTDYGQCKGFTGQTLDPESGLWQFRERYYHAQLGLFTTRDPSGYPDGVNLYAGFFGMYGDVDPSGLSTHQWHHVFPQDVFGPNGRVDLRQINIDIHNKSNGWLLPNADHSYIHRGRGGGVWNDGWNDWVDDMRAEGVIDRDGRIVDDRRFRIELERKKNQMISGEWDRYQRGTQPAHNHGEWRRLDTNGKDRAARGLFRGPGRSAAIGFTAGVGASAIAGSAFGSAVGIANAAGSNVCLTWYRMTYESLEKRLQGDRARCRPINTSVQFEQCKELIEEGGAQGAGFIGFQGAGAAFQALADRLREACEGCEDLTEGVEDAWGDE